MLDNLKKEIEALRKDKVKRSLSTTSDEFIHEFRQRVNRTAELPDIRIKEIIETAHMDNEE